MKRAWTKTGALLMVASMLAACAAEPEQEEREANESAFSWSDPFGLQPPTTTEYESCDASCRASASESTRAAIDNGSAELTTREWDLKGEPMCVCTFKEAPRGDRPGRTVERVVDRRAK